MPTHPTPRELAAIDAEWPTLAADLAMVTAETRVLAGITPASTTPLNAEPAGWLVTCPSCGLDVDYPDPDQAADAAGMHDDLLHGGRLTATVTEPWAAPFLDLPTELTEDGAR